MKFTKKTITLLTTAALLTFSGANVAADQCCQDNTGCAYDDCCNTSCWAPALALGAIAVVAIVAVAVSSSSGSSHHHGHN